MNATIDCSTGIVLRTQRTGNPAGFSIAPAAAFSPRETHLNRRFLAADLRVSRDRIRTMRQVHGTNVVQRFPQEADAADIPTADAQWTTAVDLALAVLVADCCPVVLVADRGGPIGIAHAGWRGTIAGVVPALWATLRSVGPESNEITAWIGPCAGAGEYEVGMDVARQFRKYSHALTRSPWHPERSLLDIREVIRAQLLGCGILSDRLFVSAGDTIRDTRYHSHRRDGIRAGRMAAYVLRRSGDE